MDKKLLTVKLSYSDYSGYFFIEFWEGDKYIISQKITENQALVHSRELKF